MKTFLIYYAASLVMPMSVVVASEGEGDVEGASETSIQEPPFTVADLKEVAATIRAETKHSVMLRDASLFDGVPEANVVGVIVLGDVEHGDFIEKTYEAVEVKTRFLEDLEVLKGEMPEAADDDAPEVDELAALKARATELDIQFPSNIGLERLKTKVAEAEAALAAKEAEDDANDDA